MVHSKKDEFLSGASSSDSWDDSGLMFEFDPKEALKDNDMKLSDGYSI